MSRDEVARWVVVGATKFDEMVVCRVPSASTDA
jgi:hypothetical protein